MSKVLEQAITDYKQREGAADEAFTDISACATLNEFFHQLNCKPSDLVRDDSRHDGVRRWAYQLSSPLDDGGRLLVDQDGGVCYRRPDFLDPSFINVNGHGVVHPPYRLSPGSLDPIVRYLLDSRIGLRINRRFSKIGILVSFIGAVLFAVPMILVNLGFLVFVSIFALALMMFLITDHQDLDKLRRLEPLTSFGTD